MNVFSNLATAFEQAAITGGKTPCWLLFNRSNGVYYGCAQYDKEHAFDEDYFYVIEAEMDVVYDTVVGTYPDYTIEAKADQPQEIDEAMLNSLTRSNITERYPLETQVNNMSAVLLLLAEKVGLKDDPLVVALQDQVDEIADILQNNKLRKAGYQNNDAFTYLTTEQRAQAENSKYAGGLHELMGPRVVNA